MEASVEVGIGAGFSASINISEIVDFIRYLSESY